MNPIIVRYIIGSWAYGAIRTIAYAPPLKSDDYVVDRVCKVAASSAMAPVVVPYYLLWDVRNLEHKLRQMPGKINRFPW
jgi:hypothetical protein